MKINPKHIFDLGRRASQRANKFRISFNEYTICDMLPIKIIFREIVLFDI